MKRFIVENVYLSIKMILQYYSVLFFVMLINVSFILLITGVYMVITKRWSRNTIYTTSLCTIRRFMRIRGVDRTYS